MTDHLPESLLRVFHGRGAHFRSVCIISQNAVESAAAVARQFSEQLSKNVVRIPQSIDEYEIDSYIHSHCSDDTIVVLSGIQGRTPQLISRLFRIYSELQIQLILGVDESEVDIIRRYVNYLDVSINTIVQQPRRWTQEATNAAVRQMASSFVEKNIHIAVKAGVAADDIAEFIVFPQLYLRGIPPLPSDPSERSNASDKREPQNSSDEKIFNELHTSLRSPSRMTRQLHSYHSSGKRSRRSSVLRYAKRGKIQRSKAVRTQYGSISFYHSLIAAAPYQQQRIHASETSLVYHLTTDDIRRFRFLRQPVVLHIVILDSSGSMTAAQRIRYAKGLTASLSQKAYHNREYMSLIVARGNAPKIAVSPTRSHSLLQEKLRQIPTGGRTPLYDALITAVSVIKEFIGKHNDAVVNVTIITDGKENVRARDEDTQKQVQRLRKLSSSISVVPTSGIESAHSFALQIGARYYPIPITSRL
jgi:Mg-chelatase subunit ChlD